MLKEVKTLSERMRRFFVGLDLKTNHRKLLKTDSDKSKHLI